MSSVITCAKPSILEEVDSSIYWRQNCQNIRIQNLRNNHTKEVSWILGRNDNWFLFIFYFAAKIERSITKWIHIYPLASIETTRGANNGPRKKISQRIRIYMNISMEVVVVMLRWYRQIRQEIKWIVVECRVWSTKRDRGERTELSGESSVLCTVERSAGSCHHRPCPEKHFSLLWSLHILI